MELLDGEKVLAGWTSPGGEGPLWLLKTLVLQHKTVHGVTVRRHPPGFFFCLLPTSANLSWHQPPDRALPAGLHRLAGGELQLHQLLVLLLDALQKLHGGRGITGGQLNFFLSTPRGEGSKAQLGAAGWKTGAGCTCFPPLLKPCPPGGGQGLRKPLFSALIVRCQDFWTPRHGKCYLGASCRCVKKGF